MKRAEVCRISGQWFVDLYPYDEPPYPSPDARIAERHGGTSFPDVRAEVWDPHPTHEAALAHALAAVGLAEKNTEKEKNR